MTSCDNPGECVGGCTRCAMEAAASSAVMQTPLGDEPKSWRRYYALRAAAADAEARAADLDAMAEDSSPFPSEITTAEHYREMARHWRDIRDDAKRREGMQP